MKQALNGNRALYGSRHREIEHSITRFTASPVAPPNRGRTAMPPGRCATRVARPSTARP